MRQGQASSGGEVAGQALAVSVTTRVAIAGFVVQGGRMDVAFVLVHSPSVGPLTWAPIAERMEASGIRVIVPTLVGVADASAPFWRPVVRAVRDAIEQIPQGQPIVLVAHSNAGLFVPVIVDASPRRVAGCLFADAALPSPTGSTPVASTELLDFLRPKVADGRLPQWTEWWDESDVAAERGWAVEHVPGRHLHQRVDPEAVTAELVAMAAAWH